MICSNLTPSLLALSNNWKEVTTSDRLSVVWSRSLDLSTETVVLHCRHWDINYRADCRTNSRICGKFLSRCSNRFLRFTSRTKTNFTGKRGKGIPNSANVLCCCYITFINIKFADVWRDEWRKSVSSNLLCRWIWLKDSWSNQREPIGGLFRSTRFECIFQDLHSIWWHSYSWPNPEGGRILRKSFRIANQFSAIATFLKKVEKELYCRPRSLIGSLPRVRWNWPFSCSFSLSRQEVPNGLFCSIRTVSYKWYDGRCFMGNWVLILINFQLTGWVEPDSCTDGRVRYPKWTHLSLYFSNCCFRNHVYAWTAFHLLRIKWTLTVTESFSGS